MMNMESHNHSWFCCFLAFILFASTVSSFAMAETHYHEFVIRATPVKRLCNTRSTITVNGQFPGPTLEVRNGDSLVVKVTNQAQYNATIHWHGIKQLRTAWADGPSFVTQCPIRPGGTYTYRFTIEQQEGTLWWHAHSSWLRATVYGALIIYPKLGTSYPFPKPNKEFSLLLGEWWNSDPVQVINQAVRTGGGPNVSDAYTINGQPGDFYNCSSQDTMIVPVQSGETNMLRIVNSAMNQLLFFTIANHQMTVVAADACYMKPFTTSVIMLGPGQTTDVIIKTNQRPGNYYMAARAYASARGGNVPFDNTTTTAILQYQPKAQTRPIRPTLPRYTDTNTVTAFDKNFRTLTIKTPVPTEIDEHLFFTIGLGLNPCRPGPNCQGPNNNSRFTASTSNISFVLPSTLSIIQSYYQKSPNKVFKSSFPAFPLKYDYTGNVPRPLWKPMPGTEALTLKFGSTVQLVLQDQKIYAAENHPIHLHGYSFYVVGTGFGNFDPKNDPAKFNLVDPPKRNTIGVPTGGWAVIRFKADNPGVWLMHCHIDTHLTWGLAMVFVVEDGIGELETLEPPPSDLPPC